MGALGADRLDVGFWRTVLGRTSWRTTVTTADGLTVGVEAVYLALTELTTAHVT